jgi:head-tail adaptor
MPSARSLQPIQSGQLRHRGNIEQRTAGTDAGGSPLTVYTTVYENVPMDINDYRGNESFVAQTVESSQTAYITVRYLPAMNAQMRVRHIADPTTDPPTVDYYDVVGIMYDPTRRRGMLLQCVKRDSSGFRTGQIP